MTKEELVKDIAKKTGIKELEVSHAIRIFVEEVKRKLDNGENVDLPGFGNFKLGDDK